MLVLSRKCGESIHIGNATVTIVDLHGGRVGLGIEAPRHVKIFRDEVLERTRAQRQAIAPVLETQALETKEWVA